MVNKKRSNNKTKKHKYYKNKQITKKYNYRGGDVPSSNINEQTSQNLKQPIEPKDENKDEPKDENKDENKDEKIALTNTNQTTPTTNTNQTTPTTNTNQTTPTTNTNQTTPTTNTNQTTPTTSVSESLNKTEKTDIKDIKDKNEIKELEQTITTISPSIKQSIPEVVNALDSSEIKNISLVSRLLSVAGQFTDNVITYFVNEGAEMVGIDPNKTPEELVAEMRKKVEHLNIVLKSPEGQALLSEIKELIDNTAEDVINPAINTITENVTNSFGKIATEGTKAATNIAEEVPVLGAVIGTTRVIGNAVKATNEAMELGNNMLNTANDVTEKMKSKKERANNILNQINELLDYSLNLAERTQQDFKKYNETMATKISSRESLNQTTPVIPELTPEEKEKKEKFNQALQSISATSNTTSNTTSNSSDIVFGGTKKRKHKYVKHHTNKK